MRAVAGAAAEAMFESSDGYVVYGALVYSRDWDGRYEVGYEYCISAPGADNEDTAAKLSVFSVPSQESICPYSCLTAGHDSFRVLLRWELEVYQVFSGAFLG